MKQIEIKQIEDKYLKVTIHDNDFTTSLNRVCELLYDVFCNENKFPTKEDFPVLKKSIQHLLFGANMTLDLARWGEIVEVDFNYFLPELELVNYSDIPDWDNKESIYIPMFDEAEIIVR